jgi:hypothetical protein
MSIAPPPSVRRRRVFFIAGFDPKRPRYYHALYRSQARKQAAVSGLRLQVDTERREPWAHGSSWSVQSEAEADPAGDAVQTDYEMLCWDDIVRNHWADSAWRVWVDGLKTVLFGLRDGAVQRMYRLYRPPVYATLFPLVALLLSALLATALGLVLGWVLARHAAWPVAAAWGSGAAAALALTLLAAQAVHRIHFTWLLRLVRFTHLQCTGRVPELEARLDAFAERIHAALQPADGEPAPDEVLVVGHSVGATLAIGVLARLLDRQAAAAAAAGPGAAPGPRLPVLLSLGHCLPLMTSLSPASRERQDLARVAASPIAWLDVSAPIDWAAFPAVDPVAGAGLPAEPPGWHPLLVSPRFHQLFGPEAYARLKRNRFQVHLQYLMAAERPGRYDYFAVTAGPQTLRERFERPESPE